MGIVVGIHVCFIVDISLFVHLSLYFAIDLNVNVFTAGHNGAIFPGHGGTCSTVPRCAVVCLYMTAAEQN